MKKTQNRYTYVRSCTFIHGTATYKTDRQTPSWKATKGTDKNLMFIGPCIIAIVEE